MSQPDLAQTLAKDRHFLQTAFKNPKKYGGLPKVEEKYRKSHETYLKRKAALPKPRFDGTLPVHERLDDIKTAIQNNQVTIICGETGSGKTTQLPKICLELGRGAAGLIGHTQPRRLAARSVAERIAEELGSDIGQAVGYKVRFNDNTSRDASVKLMTDGILLAETQTDRHLAAYDTLIIDEAHERSLNIDFLLGYLKQLLPRRPDLKVIITSATIDAERFSKHFDNAPVLEVSGRTYPVEILYRPLHEKDEDDAEIEITDAIVDAADELARLGEGDILVFLPGEREIREAAEALRKSPLRRNDEILPLFARLSHAEQHKIFHPTGSKRRIVLATNVAETSLTVPGIKYVIDTGLARVKRYSARAKVEQLHVEKIAQAAARQRAGRCGRVSAGVCIRLYSEEDFEQRPPFTDPEIIRSNLAAVILRMASLNLGDVSAFPFLEAPDQRYINDGFQVLLELGATNNNNRLTRLGEQMARLPIDPKIARILLAAKKHDCMAEILVIAAALSVQDPRERPLEAREAAAKAHERFADKQSDFLAYLNIWDSFQRERDKGLSNRQLVQWCRQYFLSHLRMREWRELHHQLAQTAIEMGLTTKEAAFRQPESQKAPRFDYALLSDKYRVAPLGKQDVEALYRLSLTQPEYWRTLNETPDRRKLAHSLTAVPPGADAGNKFYLGFWQGHKLIAVLELVFGYPEADCVLIGLLMADGHRQRQGLGTDIVRRLEKQLAGLGYKTLVLSYAEGNRIARSFWLKNGFRETGDADEYDDIRLIAMEKTLADKAGDQDLSAKLKQKQLDKKQHRAQIRAAKEAGYEQIHRALLTGLIANVGMKSPDGHDYTGARGSHFHLFPASTLFKAKPKWVMAAELVETTRLYARDVAAIQPEWIEQEAPHLVRYHYFEPHWEQKRGEVVASERVTLYGLTVLPRRPVSYGRIAPEEAREIFIRSALVAQECSLNAPFFAHNKKLIKEIAELEHKSRKQDVLVDEEALFDFYNTRLPETVWQDKRGGVWSEEGSSENFGSMVAWVENPTSSENTVGCMAQATHADVADKETAGQTFMTDKTETSSERLPENVGRAFMPDTNNAAAQPTSLSDDQHPPAPSPRGGGLGRGQQTQGLPSAAAPSKKQRSSENRKPLPLADLRTFQAWLQTAERGNPRLLFLSRDDLMQHAAAHITEEQFPKTYQTPDGKYKLTYRFEPHHPLDGVTLTLPLTVLNRISPAELEWLVPGMLREKIQLLIKALPKQIRRICVPVPEFITKFLESHPKHSEPIIPQLAHFIAKTAGDMRLLDQIDQDAWRTFRLPEHCYFNLRIIDDGGQELAIGRDLNQLQQELGQAAAVTFRDNTQEFERDNVTAWDIGTLPESIKFARGKQQLTGYLALQKEKNGNIALRLFDTPQAAAQAHRQGVIELMKLQLKEHVKDLNKGIQGYTQAAMLLKHIPADTLRDDLTQAVCDRAFIGEDELPRNEKAFKEQIKRARSRLPAVKEALSRYLQDTAAAYAELNPKLGKHPLTTLLRQRLQTLLAPGFASQTPWQQWQRLPIYLKAMPLRLDKYSSNPARDAAREADIQELEQMWQEKTDGLTKQGKPVSDDLAAFKWMIEELRVSLFAQELKTPYPVSVKRLLKEWEKLK